MGSKVGPACRGTRCALSDQSTLLQHDGALVVTDRCNRKPEGLWRHSGCGPSDCTGIVGMEGQGDHAEGDYPGMGEEQEANLHGLSIVGEPALARALRLWRGAYAAAAD